MTNSEQLLFLPGNDVEAFTQAQHRGEYLTMEPGTTLLHSSPMLDEHNQLLSSMYLPQCNRSQM